MKSRKMKTVSGIISIAMIVAMISFYVIPSAFIASAATSGTPAWQVSKSKTATELDANHQTSVTLSLPAGSYDTKSADIVFVVDSSAGSDYTDYEAKAADLLDRLETQAVEKGVKVKIGSIVFDGWGHDGYSLVKEKGDGVINQSKLVTLSDDTKADIKKAIVANTKTKYLSYHVPHSNTEQPIRMANQWLAEDTSVAAANKYVVVISDWLTYVYGGTTKLGDSSYTETPVSKNFKGDGIYLEQIPSDGRNLTDLFSAYDSGTLQQNANWNNDVFDDAGYGEVGGPLSWAVFFQQIYKNTTTSTAPDTVTSAQLTDMLNSANCNAKGVTAYEKSLCLTRAALQNSISSGYKVITYSDDSSNSYYDKEFKNMPADFQTWLSSQTGISNTVKSTGGTMSTFLDSVGTKVINLLEKGTVTDQIASKFDLVTNGDASPFTLTVGGTALTSAKTGTDTWSYGTADANGVYPYVVKYDKTTKTFVWSINVPVTIVNKVQLTYKLQLNDLTKTDTHIPTNVKATLNYTDGEGNTGTEDFDIPYVSYTVSTPIVVPTTHPVLSILKTETDDAHTYAAAGEKLGYTIVIKNTGDGAATNVTADDPVTSNMTFDSADNGGKLVNGSVHWDLGTLQPGESKTLKVFMVGTAVAQGASATFTNTAYAQADNATRVSSTTVKDVTNNSNADNTASVSVVKTIVGDKAYKAGDSVKYKIVVSNTGKASTLSTTTLTDYRPDGMTYQSSSSNGTYKDGKIAWNLGVIKAGESKTVYVTMSLPTKITIGQDFNNVAEASKYDAKGDTCKANIVLHVNKDQTINNNSNTNQNTGNQPKTGDTAMPGLYVVTLITAALLVLVLRRIRREN